MTSTLSHNFKHEIGCHSLGGAYQLILNQIITFLVYIAC